MLAITQHIERLPYRHASRPVSMCLFYYRTHLVVDPVTLISKEGRSWCKAMHSDTNCLNNLKGTGIVFS